MYFAAFMQFLQLHMDPASSNTLPASGAGSITQNLKVTNSQHGKVCLLSLTNVYAMDSESETLPRRSLVYYQIYLVVLIN